MNSASTTFTSDAVPRAFSAAVVAKIANAEIVTNNDAVAMSGRSAWRTSRSTVAALHTIETAQISPSAAASAFARPVVAGARAMAPAACAASIRSPIAASNFRREVRGSCGPSSNCIRFPNAAPAYGP